MAAMAHLEALVAGAKLTKAVCQKINSGVYIGAGEVEAVDFCTLRTSVVSGWGKPGTGCQILHCRGLATSQWCLVRQGHMQAWCGHSTRL